MAIYAVYGLYAVRCLAMVNRLYRSGLNPSFLANHNNVLAEGAIKNFVANQATKMGIDKEIVVIEGSCKCYHAYGNTLFSGMAGIQIAKNDKENLREFRITHQLARIKANDHLITFGAALAATLFTTLVLAVNCDLFTRYLGGLGVGLITQAVLGKRAERRADQAAMQYCSKEVNQACLETMLATKQKGYGQCLCSWIICLIKPSLDEKIGYFQAHINAT